MKRYLKLLYHLTLPFIDVRKFVKAFPQYTGFLLDLFRYKAMNGAEKICLEDILPVINEKTVEQNFDRHYFYQDIWAFKKIKLHKPRHHVDVGSRIDFVGFLTTIVPVIYVDIRKLHTQLENYRFCIGSILEMPFRDNSIESLSCLHVAEHIGLGRYGDRLDPMGTKKACKELQRVLKKGGNLYFSLPIGRPRVCFNAHRIHTVSQILDYFNELKLVEIAGIDDNGNFYPHVNPRFFHHASYACGLFHFKKP